MTSLNVKPVIPESGLALEDTMMTPIRVAITRAVVEIMEKRVLSQRDISFYYIHTEIYAPKSIEIKIVSSR